MRQIRDNAFEIVIFILLVLLVLYMSIRETNAQSAPTQIYIDCVEQLQGRFRIHFGYYAEKVEVFEVAFIRPEGSTATANVNGFIKTAVGKHIDWYIEAPNAEINNVYLVTMNGKSNYDKTDIGAGGFNQCQQTVSAVATVAPTQAPVAVVTDECPAWAVDGNNGGKICLWSLKRVGDWQ